MMPYCEYHKCKRVATTEARLLRMWDSYHHRDASNHTQRIWLCDKHLAKINKLLGIEKVEEKTS